MEGFQKSDGINSCGRNNYKGSDKMNWHDQS